VAGSGDLEQEQAGERRDPAAHDLKDSEPRRANITAVYDRHSYDPEKRAALDWWDVKLHAILMSIKVAYKDGVFEPIENVESVRPGKIYTAFSDEELRDIRETFG
jgi:hypothetical protein